MGSRHASCQQMAGCFHYCPPGGTTEPLLEPQMYKYAIVFFALLCWLYFCFTFSYLVTGRSGWYVMLGNSTQKLISNIQVARYTQLSPHFGVSIEPCQEPWIIDRLHTARSNEYENPIDINPGILGDISIFCSIIILILVSFYCLFSCQWYFQRRQQANEDSVHTAPDPGVGERVSFQSVPNQATPDRDCSHPLSIGTANKNLVPEPENEMEKGAQASEH